MNGAFRSLKRRQGALRDVKVAGKRLEGRNVTLEFLNQISAKASRGLIRIVP